MNLQEYNDQIVITGLPYPEDKSPGDTVFEWKIIKMYSEEYNHKRYKGLTLGKATYVPKSKDRLYFYPACNVPRYKVREWGKKNDISITVKEDKATAKFATSESIKSCIDYGTYLKCERLKFISWLGTNNYDVSIHSGIITALTNSTNEFIYIERYRSNMSAFLTTIDWQGNPSSSAKRGLIQGLYEKGNKIATTDYFSAETITQDNYKIIDSILQSTVLFDQEDIISIINEDAITIDKVMYSRLRDMFGNNSKADHLVALEIVGNSNINPSLHHILLLLREFSQNIMNLKESKHINFKSLLEYIGIRRSDMYYLNEDKIVNILMDKNVLTLGNVKELADGIKIVMKQNADTQHFLISKITVSNKIKEYLINKQNQVQEEPVLN
jgi:hypothetical protein